LQSASIVITARSEGSNLRRTVDSILANTPAPDFDVLLIDDGSTDNGFRFLDEKRYREDQRLRRYRFDQPVGLIRARHEGVRRTRGDMIAFLDAHVAVPPNWLATLMQTMERWGEQNIITPDISVLDEKHWLPTPPLGQVMTVNDSLEMVWSQPPYLTDLVPVVVGCAWLISRRLYYQIGGFDLGLRRWGCENIDICLKAYAAGGACYLERSVVVGHLFRGEFPYAIDGADVTYNKLRTAYIHFSDETFRRVLERLRAQPGFSDARARFQEDLSELNQHRRRQRAAARRDPEWFVRTFWRPPCVSADAKVGA
jgi:glycosyltransferase involved in cell wall biosynthesis